MPNSLEIYQNTLLKQIMRQGVNSDRINIVLDSGEIGYTTDTQRLFVGDGATSGGNLIGNLWKGYATDITTLNPSELGDYVFDTDNSKFYILTGGTGASSGDWLHVGGVITPANGTIVINANNTIQVGTISASQLDSNLFEAPIFLNGSNQIALSATVPVDYLYPRNSTALTLYETLSINRVVYNFPSTTPSENQILKVSNIVSNSADVTFVDLSAMLVDTPVVLKTITVTGSLTSTANGIDSTGTPMNPLTADIVIGTAPGLSCCENVSRYIRYDGELELELYTEGISASRTAKGRYTFNYPTLPHGYPYASVGIIGADNRGWQARITTLTDSECTVEITALDNNFLYRDAPIALKIEA